MKQQVRLTVALISLICFCAALTRATFNLPDPLKNVRPSQHRLAYHGTNGMTVSWSTTDRLDTPKVYYGLTPFTLLHLATSHTSQTYETSTKYANTVVLDHLLADTTYYYRVSNSLPDQTYSFKTAKQAGNHDAYTAALVVDMGTFGEKGLSSNLPKGVNGALAPGEVTTIQRMSNDLEKFDLILHPGDFAYADYWLKEEVLGYLDFDLSKGPELYEEINQEYYDQMQNITARRPYMVAPGNHEANCDNGGYKNFTESLCPEGQRNFTAYVHRFDMPSDVSGGVGNFWYSFDYGMTHYVMFDTETDLGNGLVGAEEQEGPFGKTMNAQLNFIKQDLQKVDRKKTPWIVAAGHRPWYMAADPSDLCIKCQSAFEPLFNEYKVDLVVQGHVHAMNRNAPIAKNVTDPNGLNNPSAPWYIVNGAAGHFDGLDSLPDTIPDYVEYVNNKMYAYSRLTFHNATHLTHDFVASATGEIVDSATLYKEH